jgi:hypothetical protein
MAYKPDEIEIIFNKILFKIELGHAIRNILKEDGMPDSSTFYKWIDLDSEKSKRYARACELRADSIFEDILEIADDSSGDVKINEDGEEYLNTEFVQRSRLRVEARKWVVSKLNPKKYGDKQETTHVFEQPIFTGINLDVPTDNSTG